MGHLLDAAQGPVAAGGHGEEPPLSSTVSVSVGSTFEVPGLEYIVTPERLQVVLAELTDVPEIGFDLETTGLNPLQHRIRLGQIATSTQTFVIDFNTIPVRLLTPLLQQPQTTFCIQNAKFELKFFQAHGLPWPAHVDDSMIRAQLLGASAEPRPKGYYQLDAIADRMLGVQLDKSFQKADWTGDLSSEQLLYAARDAAVMLPLAAALRTACAAADLDRVYGIEAACLPALAWLEQAGVLVDDVAWAERAAHAERQADVLEAELSAMLHRRLLGRTVPHQHRHNKQDVVSQLVPEQIDWDSPAQLLSVFACLGHPIANTAETTLTALAPDEPLSATLLAHRDARQRMKMAGADWLRKHLSPLSHRVYGDYQQIGGRSGRMSCRAPNMQQVPRSTEYRSSIIAAPDHVLIKGDYSQIEVRIGAVKAPEPKMLQAYTTGADLHRATAAAIFQCTEAEVTPERRQLGKTINLALLFGMGAARLREKIFTETKQTVTLDEARHFKQAYRRQYPGIAQWHDRTGRDLRWHGAIDARSLTGRRRLGVTKYTELLNTPVQGSAADGMKIALAHLYAHRHELPDAWPVLIVHDEMVIEAPRAQADEAAQWLKHHMEAGMSEVVGGQVPIEAEVHIGTDWAGTPLEA